MRQISAYACGLAMVFAACGTPQSSAEEVVAQYIGYLSEGRYDAAQDLCTPAGAAYLKALQELMLAADDSLIAANVHVDQLQCTQTDSTAVCSCRQNDGVETFTESYRLVMTPKGWRVDVHELDGETTRHEEAATEAADSDAFKRDRE